MMGNLEVPVYLFTGFLGSGKTTFLMDLLSGEDFYDGERTMVLLCEEGEVELDPEQFAFPDVFVERIWYIWPKVASDGISSICRSRQ